MVTPSALIETCGGDRAVSEALGARIATVRVWKCRDAIPRSMWADIIVEFPNVTLDMLREAHAARAGKAEAA